MFKNIGLIILAVSMLNVSCANSGKRDVAATNGKSKIQNLINDLDGTQWTGTAKAYDAKEFFNGLGKAAVSLLVKVLNKDARSKDFGSDDANMAFQVLDGRLYYLSEIFPISDEKIKEKSMGLCDYSPPREAVFRLDDRGNVLGDIVLPERSRGKDGVLSPVSFYSAPLLSVKLSTNNLGFVAKPFSTIEKLGGALKPVEVTYKMVKTPSAKTEALADKLSYCLKHKPWENKK